MYEELDRVRLTDGTEAVVLLVFDNGVAYEVEYPVPTDKRYEQCTVYASEIEARVGHV